MLIKYLYDFFSVWSIHDLLIVLEHGVLGACQAAYLLKHVHPV